MHVEYAKSKQYEAQDIDPAIINFKGKGPQEDHNNEILTGCVTTVQAPFRNTADWTAMVEVKDNCEDNITDHLKLQKLKDGGSPHEVEAELTQIYAGYECNWIPPAVGSAGFIEEATNIALKEKRITSLSPSHQWKLGTGWAPNPVPPHRMGDKGYLFPGAELIHTERGIFNKDNSATDKFRIYLFTPETMDMWSPWARKLIPQYEVDNFPIKSYQRARLPPGRAMLPREEDKVSILPSYLTKPSDPNGTKRDRSSQLKNMREAIKMLQQKLDGEKSYYSSKDPADIFIFLQEVDLILDLFAPEDLRDEDRCNIAI